MRELSSMNRAEDDKAEMRSGLIDAAATLVAVEGPGALTIRRVAEEVGTSTMGIYTHFGGMPELRRAVRREGYARLASALARIDDTDDPVYDLAMIGRAYTENAVKNPHLYRVMFMEQPLDQADAEIGSDTRESLTGAIRRCIDASRFAPADPGDLARQFWAFGHGVVALALVGLLSPEQARCSLLDGVLSLFIGFGDDPRAARRSAGLATHESLA
jgi:AcrR family transcriptional regulator